MQCSASGCALATFGAAARDPGNFLAARFLRRIATGPLADEPMASDGAGVTRGARRMRDELLDRARQLAPRLAERCEQAERLRDLPAETVRDFHEAGLFRMLQPRRVGGAECDYGILIDVGAAIARACVMCVTV